MAVVQREMPRKVNANPDLGVGNVRNVGHTLLIGGLKVPGLLQWSKNELAYSAGSSVTLSLRGELVDNQEWLSVSQEVLPLPVVLTTDLAVDGKAVFTDAEEFSGVVDTIDYDPKTNVYSVNVSSYARVLVNTKISETLAGESGSAKTTGQTIIDITKKYGKGLKVYVDPELMKTPVGKVYKEQQVKTLRNIPVWDLFQSFAQYDKADLFVKGDTLFYVRKPTNTSNNITQLKGVKANYAFTYGRNIIGVSVTHAPLFAHDVTVTVRSHQSRTDQSYESTKNMSDLEITKLAKKLEGVSRDELDKLNAASKAKLAQKRKSSSKAGKQVEGKAAVARIGNKENYVFVVPNATQEDCERIAQKIMEDIARHEFAVTLTVLGQPDFNPLQYVGLLNLPVPVLNQVYAIKSISTQSDPSSGYLTTFTLVNHEVQTVGVSLGM